MFANHKQSSSMIANHKHTCGQWRYLQENATAQLNTTQHVLALPAWCCCCRCRCTCHMALPLHMLYLSC
jgi:hypothetical protein